jgi:hypothetical protein
MENRLSDTIEVKRRNGVVIVYRVPRWPSGAPVAWQAEDKAKVALQSPFAFIGPGMLGAGGAAYDSAQTPRY